MRLTCLIFLFCLIFANGQIFQKNILAYPPYYSNRTISRRLYNIQISLMTRGRYGYSFLAIKSEKNSTNFIIVSYLNRLGTLSYYRYHGDLTNCSLSPVQNETNFYGTFDNNWHPIGKRVNDIFSNVAFTTPLFLEYYSERFNFTAGFSFNKIPSNLHYNLLENSDQFLQAETNIKKFSELKDYFIGDSTRIESIHWAYFSVVLAFLIIIFILCLVFSQQQPLKSRGSSPAIACILHIILLFASISKLTLSFEELNQSRCVIDSLVEYPAILLIILISILNFARYLVILKSNQQKLIYLSSKETSDVLKLRWPFRLLKFTSHWVFNLVLIAVCYIFLLFLYIIILGSASFNCSILSLRDFYSGIIPYYIIIAFLVIFILIVFVFDIILSFDKIRNCELKYLWKEDGFYFRVETYVFGVFITIPYVILMSILAFSFLGQIDSQALYFFLVTMMYYLAFFYQVLFVLIVTIITFILKLFKKKNSDDALVKLMKNKETHDMIYDFSKSEFSVENVACYDDLQVFKKEKDQDRMFQLATRIYKAYLSGSESELEVNISSDICKKVKIEIDSGKVQPDLFVNVERQIITNLSDTFSRLIFTRAFIQWAASSDYLKDTVAHD